MSFLFCPLAFFISSSSSLISSLYVLFIHIFHTHPHPLPLFTYRRKHFSQMGRGDAAQYTTVAQGLSVCGTCQGPMDLRTIGGNANANANDPNDPPTPNRGGGGGGGGGGNRFLFCATCEESHLVPSSGDITAHVQRCAICQFQVLTVRNNVTGKEHTVCPRCFSNPPAFPDGPAVEAAAGGGEFRCFQCAHATCPLAGRQAGSDVDVAPCAANNCAGEFVCLSVCLTICLAICLSNKFLFLFLFLTFSFSLSFFVPD